MAETVCITYTQEHKTHGDPFADYGFPPPSWVSYAELGRTKTDEKKTVIPRAVITGVSPGGTFTFEALPEGYGEFTTEGTDDGN